MKRYLAGLLVFGLAAAPQEKQSSPGDLVIRSTTRLVQISIVAQDKKGDAVTDLTKDDFVITEKGKPQAITLFSRESSAAVVRTPANQQALPPNIFTNHVSQRNGSPSSATIILLDALNTKIQDQSYAREQLIKFLKEQVKPQDRIALYSLGNNLRVLYDFTSDAGRLLAKLEKFSGRTTAELNVAETPSDTGDADLDDFINNAEQTYKDFATTNRVRQTCAAMETIAGHVMRLPGRKNLVWISSSFPLSIGFTDDLVTAGSLNSRTRDKRLFTEEVRRATQAMTQANIAVYPVDARGLTISADFTAERAGGRLRSGVPPRSGVRDIAENRDAMQVLADRTGGKAFFNTNDLNAAIRHAIDDSRVTYTVGFSPSDSQGDGKFHEIKVEVKRKGVQVRYRRGYLDLPEHEPSEKEQQIIVRDAALSPLEGEQIGLAARLDPAAGGNPKERSVVVQIDVNDLHITPDQDRHVGRLEVDFVVLDENDRVIGGEKTNLDLKLTPEKFARLQKDGAILTQKLTISEKAQKLKIIALDQRTGAVGSLGIPLTGALTPANRKPVR